MKSVPSLAIERIDPTWAERPGIDQYVVLSMLLHVFALVALGDTRGGDSRAGARGHGSILVSLNAPPAVERVTVRPAPARAQEDAQPQPRRAAPAVAAPDTPASAPGAKIEVPPAITPIATPQVTTEFAPAPTLPANGFRAEPLAPLAAPAPAATFAEPPAVPEAVRLPAALAPVAPAAVHTEFARPVELKAAERPVLSTLAPIAPPVVKDITQAVPGMSAERVQAPAPLARVEAPALKPFASPSKTKALEAPSALAQPLAPLAPVAPARIDREFASPEFVKPSEVAVSVPPAIEKVAAPKLEKEFAPAREYTRPEPERAPEAARTATRTADPPPEAQPSIASPPPGESAIVSPRADPRLPTFGVSPPAALPKTDLDSLKERARQIAREGTGPRTAIPFFTAPPAPKKEVEKAFDKALKRPECKDAYADMGLAAVIPLVRDAVTDKGCKW